MSRPPATTYRLSPESRSILSYLSSRRGQSMTSILERLLREEYRRELKIDDLYLELPVDDGRSISLLSQLDIGAERVYKGFRDSGIGVLESYTLTLRDIERVRTWGNLAAVNRIIEESEG